MITAGYLTDGNVSHSFMRSWIAALDDLRAWGAEVNEIWETCTTAQMLAHGRNGLVSKFLETDDEWLIMCDTDMGFNKTAFYDLWRVAASDDFGCEKPIVGALCFARRWLGPDAYNAMTASIIPTIYKWHGDQEAYKAWVDYPRDQVVECDATGAALLIVHRSVFQEIPSPWFISLDMGEKVFSEDLTFCMKAKHKGFDIYVDTSVKTSHDKNLFLTESTYDSLESLGKIQQVLKLMTSDVDQQYEDSIEEIH